MPLEAHWNGDFLRKVRRKMLAGEPLPECVICASSSLGANTHQKYFTDQLFPQLIQVAYDSTDENGFTQMKPISFDYRFSNACTLKCRTCGPQHSSKWEAEYIESQPQVMAAGVWGKGALRKKLTEFQKGMATEELLAAIQSGKIQEIYWAGGEPLLWEEHWKFMGELIQNGACDFIKVRYNTNLSNLRWRDLHLFEDILSYFKNYTIYASIDAAGRIGEFIRTGLHWESWVKNLKSAKEYTKNRKGSIVMDVTVTLPGLFGMKALMDLANDLQIVIQGKMVLPANSRNIFSPLALPRRVLHELLTDLIEYGDKNYSAWIAPLLETLQDLKKRPCIDEEFPGVGWQSKLSDGKMSQMYTANIRKDGIDGRLSIEEIYAANPAVLSWWNSIST